MRIPSIHPAIRLLLAIGISIALHVGAAYVVPAGARVLANYAPREKLTSRLNFRLVRAPPQPRQRSEIMYRAEPPHVPSRTAFQSPSSATDIAAPENPTSPIESTLGRIDNTRRPANLSSQPERSTEAIAGIGHYHPSDELSVIPTISVEPMLDRTFETSMPMTGTVVLQVFVGQNGVVDKVVPDREASQLPMEYQDAAAEAFKSAHFSPGEIKGRPVGAVLRMEVNFDAPPVLPE